MPSWTSMRDLAPNDVVVDTDMDAIRENLGFLLAPPESISIGAVSSSTSSTSFVTLASAVFVSNGGHVLQLFHGTCSSDTAGVYTALDFSFDGTRISGTAAYGLYMVYHPTGTRYQGFTLAYLHTSVTAGSHTYATLWRVSSGTSTMYNGTYYQHRLVEL